MDKASEADRLLQLQLRVGEFEKFDGMLWNQLHYGIVQWIRSAVAELVEPQLEEFANLEVTIADDSFGSSDKLITYTVTQRAGSDYRVEQE